MQKPLSSTQITIDSINLLPLSSPLKCKSVIYSQQSCDNINFFLSALTVQWKKLILILNLKRILLQLINR